MEECSTRPTGRIVAVRITVSDPAVRSVDEEFALLVDRGLPTGFDRVTLSIVRAGHSAAALAADGPLPAMRDDVLICTLVQDKFQPLKSKILANAPARQTTKAGLGNSSHA